MRGAARLLIAVAILSAVVASGTPGAESRTLNGEYVWNQGSSGSLDAIFTPSGEGRWNVSFRFKFQGERHTYTGAARGSLSDGSLEGTVRNENKRRTFTFQGTFEGGEFRGTHAETTSGRAGNTGTMTLS